MRHPTLVTYMDCERDFISCVVQRCLPVPHSCTSLFGPVLSVRQRQSGSLSLSQSLLPPLLLRGKLSYCLSEFCAPVASLSLSLLLLLLLLRYPSLPLSLYLPLCVSLTAMMPCTLTAIMPCTLTAVMPCILTAIMPCTLTAVMPCILTAVMPCILTAVMPCNLTAVCLAF